MMSRSATPGIAPGMVTAQLPRDDTVRASLMGLARDAAAFLISPSKHNQNMLHHNATDLSSPTALEFPIPTLVVDETSPQRQMMNYRAGVIDPALQGAWHGQHGENMPSVLAPPPLSREGTASPGSRLEKRGPPPPLDLSRSSPKYDSFRPSSGGAGANNNNNHNNMMRYPAHFPPPPSQDRVELKYLSSASSSLPSPADTAFTQSPPISPASGQLGHMFTSYPTSSPLVTNPPMNRNAVVDAELAAALAGMSSHSPAPQHPPLHQHQNQNPNPHAFSIGQFDADEAEHQHAYAMGSEHMPPPFHAHSGSSSHSPASYGESNSNSPYAQPISDQEVDYLALMYPSPPPTAGAALYTIAPHWTIGTSDDPQTTDDEAMHHHGHPHHGYHPQHSHHPQQVDPYMDPSFYASNAFGITLDHHGLGVPPPQQQQQQQLPQQGLPSPARRKRRLPSGPQPSHQHSAPGDRKPSTKGPRKMRSRKFSKTGGLVNPPSQPHHVPPVPRIPSSVHQHPHPYAHHQSDFESMSDDEENTSSREDEDEDEQVAAALADVDLTEQYEELSGAGGGGATRRFRCKMCGKLFPRKSAILSHVQMHLDIRPFVCSWPGCKQKFVRNHDLGRHVRSRHTRVKPFVCACGQCFSRGDALTRHQQRKICIGGIEGGP